MLLQQKEITLGLPKKIGKNYASMADYVHFLPDKEPSATLESSEISSDVLEITRSLSPKEDTADANDE